MNDTKGPIDADPRLKVIYDEAVRGIVQQQTLVDNFGSRAGSVIFAAAFASSLLGAQALADGADAWDWAAMGLLLVLGVLIAFLLWPYQAYRFRFDPNQLLAEHIDANPASTLADMHRQLAVRMEADRRGNWRLIQRQRAGLQVALVLLVADIVAWMLAIATTP